MHGHHRVHASPILLDRDMGSGPTEDYILVRDLARCGPCLPRQIRSRHFQERPWHRDLRPRRPASAQPQLPGGGFAREHVCRYAAAPSSHEEKAELRPLVRRPPADVPRGPAECQGGRGSELGCSGQHLAPVQEHEQEALQGWPGGSACREVPGPLRGVLRSHVNDWQPRSVHQAEDEGSRGAAPLLPRLAQSDSQPRVFGGRAAGCYAQPAKGHLRGEAHRWFGHRQGGRGRGCSTDERRCLLRGEAGHGR
mmetsp:Transcript_135610/g.321369  ORF Transcript_135610/g.321369 Transcript_135610/m.321369 type:complete len:252 (-) Transcript_135610:610-1365(-)